MIFRVLIENSTIKGSDWEIIEINEIAFDGVGHSAVKQIEYHVAAGEGDSHYVDITFINGIIRRIFRPSEVFTKVDIDA